MILRVRSGASYLPVEDRMRCRVSTQWRDIYKLLWEDVLSWREWHESCSAPNTHHEQFCPERLLRRHELARRVFEPNDRSFTVTE